MPVFHVPDMSCKHCVQSITRAIQAADANAEIATDLEQHHVTVNGSKLDAPALHAIITEAGYTPTTLS